MSRGHFSPNNSRKTSTGRPLGRCICVFQEFEFCPKIYLRSCCAGCNVVLYFTAIYRWSIGLKTHYNDVIMGAIASQITHLTIVYSPVYSGADQSKHQSSASLALVWGIHRGPVNSPHKWPVTRKMFPLDDVIMPPAVCMDSHFTNKITIHYPLMVQYDASLIFIHLV